MAGWVPTPADGWAEIAEVLSAFGRPWPESAAITDLRWHEDQGRVQLGYRSAMGRWHWSERAVRKLMRDEERWRDPLRVRTTVRSVSAPPSAVASHPDTDIPTESARDVRTTVRSVSAPPSAVASDTRAVDPPYTLHPHTHGAEQTNVIELPTPDAPPALRLLPPQRTKPLPKGWKEAAAAWAKASGSKRQLSPGKGLGKQLAARLQDHGGVAVQQVIRWYADSPDKRAAFLRSGGYGLQTLMRPEKFEEYATLAEVWSRDGEPDSAGGGDWGSSGAPPAVVDDLPDIPFQPGE